MGTKFDIYVFYLIRLAQQCKHLVIVYVFKVALTSCTFINKSCTYITLAPFLMTQNSHYLTHGVSTIKRNLLITYKTNVYFISMQSYLFLVTNHFFTFHNDQMIYHHFNIGIENCWDEFGHLFHLIFMRSYLFLLTNPFFYRQ